MSAAANGMPSLSGKVAVVTGAARGIGRATAEALSAKGALVGIGDLDLELAEGAAAEMPGRAIGLRLDVSDHDEYVAFLDRVEAELGPIDVLVNNAGICPLGPFDEETDASTARQVAINLVAVMLGTKEAMRRMKPRGTGHIVNLSSAAGKAPNPHAASYSATKFGVAGFSEAIAAELHGTGVGISCVYPSMVNTDLIKGVQTIPGLKVEPEDVADAIVGAVERKRFSVPVPRAMGFALNMNQAMPYKLRGFFGRQSGELVKGADHSARTEYEARVAREVSADRDGPADE